MSIFKIDINEPINNNGGSQAANYAKVEASRVTEFGTIDPDDYTLIQYNLLVESTSKTSNNTTNIRSTLTGKAIRTNKFDFPSGKFDPNYPEHDVYSFCDPELAIIFQNGVRQYTRKVENDSGYPLDVSLESVYDSVQTNQYGKFTTSAKACCPPPLVPDPITGICVPPEKCQPDPVTPCPEPELYGLKPIIYGYAVYVDYPTTIDIPNIGPQVTRCSGGHACSRTHFQPRLKLKNGSTIYSSNPISMDNFDPSLDVMQYMPFVTLSGRNRSDSFTFTGFDPILIDDSCVFSLDCLSITEYGCHSGVTMIWLVGQRADNDEYVLLFADCVAPGPVNGKFIGHPPCNNDDPPVDCEPPPPPPPTGDYLFCCYPVDEFGNVINPASATGDEPLACFNAINVGVLGEHCSLNVCPEYCS